MRIDEKTYQAMPENIRAMFRKAPNPGSEEVLELFPNVKAGIAVRRNIGHSAKGNIPFATGSRDSDMREDVTYADSGSAARFFYCAKASRAEREAGMGEAEERPMLWSAGTQNPGSFQSENTHRAAKNNHPTVKPLALMRYLCRLVTPPGGVVLDPFMGSGTTGMAAGDEGFEFIGIELNADYLQIAERRIRDTRAQIILPMEATT